MSNIIDISHLKLGAEASKSYTSGLVSTLASTTAEAIEEVEKKIPTDYIVSKEDSVETGSLSTAATTAYVDSKITEAKEYATSQGYITEEQMKIYIEGLSHITKTEMNAAIQVAITDAIDDVY